MIKKILTILMLTMMISCGQEPIPGPTGPQGEQGPPGEDLVEIPMGFSGAIECAEEALPDYELKSFSVNQNNGDVTIKLKEKDEE